MLQCFGSDYMSSNSLSVSGANFSLRKFSPLPSDHPSPSMSFRLNHLRTVLQAVYKGQTKHRMTSTNKSPTTAGLIVIGDEILKGQVRDSVIHFLGRSLYGLGIPLRKVSVVPDDIEAISKEVKQFHQDYSFVFTSGGIGSTHDDVTFEAVGRAFDEGTHFHPHLTKVVRSFFQLEQKDQETADATLKLAKVPISAVLHFAPERHPSLSYPAVSVKNVFIFPGVPVLFEKAFKIIQDSLCHGERVRLLTENVYIKQAETAITTNLNRVVDAFKGRASFGSYPDLFNSFYRVRITIEASDTEVLEEATTALKKEIGGEHVVNYDPHPIRNAALKVYELAACDSPVGLKTRSAIEVIENAFKKYPKSISIGFNGGKDCTALLHLVYAVHCRRRMHFDSDDGSGSECLSGLYIRSRWAFPEVEQFIENTVTNYSLDLVRIEGQMKPALCKLKNSHPEIRAVIMGSRSTDPYCAKLSFFEKTDPDWPDYMRVNPIIDWTYSDVWQFLRLLSVPYCQMYDRGYTSLGSQENTHPNPALRKVTESGIVEYRPAFELVDAELERSGRG